MFSSGVGDSWYEYDFRFSGVAAGGARWHGDQRVRVELVILLSRSSWSPVMKLQSSVGVSEYRAVK